MDQLFLDTNSISSHSFYFRKRLHSNLGKHMHFIHLWFIIKFFFIHELGIVIVADFDFVKDFNWLFLC